MLSGRIKITAVEHVIAAVDVTWVPFVVMASLLLLLFLLLLASLQSLLWLEYLLLLPSLLPWASLLLLYFQSSLALAVVATCCCCPPTTVSFPSVNGFSAGSGDPAVVFYWCSIVFYAAVGLSVAAVLSAVNVLGVPDVTRVSVALLQLWRHCCC